MIFQVAYTYGSLTKLNCDFELEWTGPKVALPFFVIMPVPCGSVIIIVFRVVFQSRFKNRTPGVPRELT